MISVTVKFIRFVKSCKDKSQGSNIEQNLEQNQENGMPQERSYVVEEPPSIINLVNQDGPTLPRNLNTLVINVNSYKDVHEEEKKGGNNIQMKAIW